MVLGEVEESVTTREIDEETDEEIVRVSEFFLSISKLYMSFLYNSYSTGLLFFGLILI